MSRLGAPRADLGSTAPLPLDFAELASAGTSGPWLGYSASFKPFGDCFEASLGVRLAFEERLPVCSIPSHHLPF